MSSRAYITGIGIHTTLGRGVSDNLRALAEPIAPAQAADIEFAGKHETLPYFLLANEPLHNLDSRVYRVLTSTINEALDAAQLTPAERESLTVFLGTSSGEISVHESHFRRDLAAHANAQPLALSRGIGHPAYWIAKHFGFQGGDFTINTACTASANALMHADAMIRSGRIERALIVGIELCNTVTALGFQGLQLLTREPMRPFDQRRRGLILGEGCSAVVLDGKQRKSGSFYLRGAANVCDTFSVSAANPDGSTVNTVIRRALQAAKLEAKDISALKAHGTASLLNDEAEVAGMKQAFASLPPLFALKPRIGHTLGACGLNELALSCAALQAGWLPGAPGVCAEAGDLGVTLNQQPQDMKPGHFMLNYFGFGGNNTSLVISNVAE